MRITKYSMLLDADKCNMLVRETSVDYREENSGQDIRMQEHLSFYVSEMMEFENYGIHQENLTLEEAAFVYEHLPEKAWDGKTVGFGPVRCGRGIGIDFHGMDAESKSPVDIHFPLYVGGVIDSGAAKSIPALKNSLLVQQAIRNLQGKFPDAIVAEGYFSVIKRKEIKP